MHRPEAISRFRSLIDAVRYGDDTVVEQTVTRLTQVRRVFVPIALAVGALAMLAQGLRLLFFNWRLSVLQIVPAMWLWVAMLDLKLHVLRGAHFRSWTGPAYAGLLFCIALLTFLSLFLNAVFAFAIARPGPPQIRSGFTLARRHLWPLLGLGVALGLALGVSTIIVPRWGLWWFSVALSIVLGVMMLLYVMIPARLIGSKAKVSRRDKLTATLIVGTASAVICTPPYALGRLGVSLLNSHSLFVVGVALAVLGFALQAAAHGTVKAVDLSAKLVSKDTSQTELSVDTVE